MSDLLDGVWKDLTQNTVLFPLELAVLVSFILLQRVPGFEGEWFPSLTQRFHRLSRRRGLSILCAFGVTLGGRFLMEPGSVLPAPGVHDEYSYLLAADTFASGRLTNPAHPMRYFFESFHILTEPTYMSMYPPGQGLMLAAGILLTGKAIAGVWLSAALAAAALCWMLQAWTSPSWALLGSLLFAVRIGFFSYWGNSYWGGCVAAIGGALLFGAAARLRRHPHWKHGLVFGLGMVLLGNTRPWEGGLISAAAFVWVCFRIFKEGKPWRKWGLPVAVPVLCCLMVGGLATEYYNYRVTGNGFRLPYIENRLRNQVHGTFIWQPANMNRQYNHEALRAFYFEWEGYPLQLGYWRVQLEKPSRLWFFFLGPALTLGLPGLWRSWKTPRLELAWVLVTVFACSHLVVPWHILPHYAAPVLGPIYLLLVEGIRRLARWNVNGIPGGRQLVRAALGTSLILMFFRSAAPALNTSVYGELTSSWYSYGLLSNYSRQKMADKLNALGGKHLVLVEYSAGHQPHQEWVYNRADIDASPVVWARNVGNTAKRVELLKYYKDRHFWIVYPDRNPNQLFDFKEPSHD
ncbi:MAG TPA: hypothetical protein VM120_02275 [Bryobacteraceae bacterium]|nr:hypothetical protein [Bryobacteraceae bacterium]